MEDLVKQQCEACRKGAPTITKEEIATLMPGLPEWKIVERGDLKPLERTFQLGNFARALSFTQMVGELAESQGHHPALLTEWGRTTVTWWTKKIAGLHHNDFIMAAKTDALFDSAFQQDSDAMTDSA